MTMNTTTAKTGDFLRKRKNLLTMTRALVGLRRTRRKMLTIATTRRMTIMNQKVKNRPQKPGG